MTSTLTNRRRLLQVGAAGLGVLAARTIAGAAKPPFKVGAIVPLTTGQAQEGKAHLDGFRLCFDTIGWEQAGRKIELIVADDEMKPPVGLQKARRLVENDNVDMIIGPVSSGVAVAMADYLKQADKLWLCSGAGAAIITREKRTASLFRSSCSTYQTNHTIGDWAPDNLGHDAILMASDYSGGRDTIEEFRNAFVAKGGRVVKEIYPPLGTRDYSAYFADVKAAKPAFVYAFFTGIDSINFVQQYAQFGLKDAVPLAGAGFLTDPEALDQMGDAALGITTALHYSTALDTPLNKTFVSSYHEATKRRPSISAEYGYVAAQVIGIALRATGGISTNPVLETAMRNIKFEAPRGPFRFDPVSQNVVNSAYLMKVERRNGVLDNYPFATFRDIVDPAMPA
jgi:branched-chain amino acid transport system substrate-binding protein